MFEPTSRYANCKDLTIIVKNYQTESGPNNRSGSHETEEAEERIVRYKERRFIPSAEKMKTLQEIVFTAGDRLDLIASRTLGDPEQFWRICDANEVMHPLDLAEEPGSIIRIAVPW